MKKNYSKPQLVFDSFELSESIAAGCYAISKQSELICPVDDPIFGVVFTGDNAGCEITSDSKDNDMECYHDLRQVFTS